MTAKRWNVTVIVVASAMYAGTIIFGLRLKSLSSFWSAPQRGIWASWEPPLESSIPDTPKGESIRRGAQLFNDTPLYAAQFTGARLSCASCHAEGGIQPFASPMIGLPALFPMYNARAGHKISLKDRIQECFVRSENGKPLDYQGPIMQALVDYIDWLSQSEPARRPYVGRGLVALSDLKPDPAKGAQIYESQCAGCHGEHGEGMGPQFPPLWGPNSFNDGAGMHGISKMAAFVVRNMPQNRPGILSPQDAYDVSSFIHNQLRPSFNTAYKKY